MFQSHNRVGAAAVLATLLGALTMPSAWAGSFEIGDADIVETFKIQALVGYEKVDGERVWERPALAFGMRLSDSVELVLGSGYGIAQPRHGDHRSGIHDALLGFKWRISEDDPEGERLAIAIEPELILPTGRRGHGVNEGVASIVVPLRAGKQYGDHRLTGQTSYSRVFGHSDEDVLSYGALYEYDLAPQVSVGIEVLNDLPLHSGGDRYLRGNAAIAWTPVPSLEIHGLFGRVRQQDGGETAVIARIGIEYQFD